MTSTDLLPALRRAPAGFFDAEQESRVLRALSAELRARGTQHLESLRERYATHVDAEDRRAAVERLVTRVEEDRLRADDLRGMIEFLYFAGDPLTLARYQLLFPAYNILQPYKANRVGPWGPLVANRPRSSARWTLLGRSVDFPIGVPASVLTANSRWISYWSSNGYNVLTYKTVRSREQAEYPQPNWVLASDVAEPFSVDRPPEVITAEDWDWIAPGSATVTTANSFGIPSAGPESWQPDVERALQQLYDNQLLLVSVLGDIYEDDELTADQLARDFVRVAAQAAETGAEVIELNLSCPNLLTSTGVQPPLCHDLALTRRIVGEVRRALPDLPLVAKLSYLKRDGLAPLVQGIGSMVQGIAGINALQLPVMRRNEPSMPTFPERREAGVSGIAIRNHALDFVRNLCSLRDEGRYTFDVIAMGGVTSPDSFRQLKSAGATAVQSASGVFTNPLLASDCLEALRDSDFPGSRPDSDLRDSAGRASEEKPFDHWMKGRIRTALSSSGPMSSYKLAASVGIRVGRTLDVLDELISAGEVEVTSPAGAVPVFALASPH